MHCVPGSQKFDPTRKFTKTLQQFKHNVKKIGKHIIQISYVPVIYD